MSIHDTETAAEAAVSILREELAGGPAGIPGGAADGSHAEMQAGTLSSWAWLGRKGIERASARLASDTASRYGLDRCGSLVVAALNYGEGPAAPPPWAAEYQGPLLRLARFARADWYAELSARLKAAACRCRARLLAAGLDPGESRDWRFLSNSGLPEKAFALAAGLGFRGRNDLVIVGPRQGGGIAEAREMAGPACVLGLLLLPFDIDALGESSPCSRSEAEIEAAISSGARGSACGSCRACIEACPTHALGEGGFRRELCRQHWSARGGCLPPEVEAAWGNMLYGCDLCLEACPRFRLDPGASCVRGALGPGLPAAWILGASEAEMGARLRGTVLGMKWMDYGAFKRSARLAIEGANII